MKRLTGILSWAGYILCTYILVSVFAAAFCFGKDAFNTFKNSDKMLIVPENVEISGNRRMAKEEILFVTGLERQISFFDADRKKMVQSLTLCGWVKKAFVEKFFPNSVKIRIEEFEPVMVVNSRQKSPDTDKDINMMWFSDADGILFKRVLHGEVENDMPIFFLNYSTPEEDKKRPERIKNAIFLTGKWGEISSPCRLKSISYEVFSGYYSIDCTIKNGLKSEIRLKDEFSSEEWFEMIKNAAGVMKSMLAENQWAGEFEFDRVENVFGEKKYEAIIGKRVQNINFGGN